MDRLPTLAAIVPATDRRPTLDRCLAAIRAARGAPEEVIPVTEPLGLGAAAARNAGAAAATADVLVFIDSDVVVHDDAFARLREAFAADPKLTAVFGSYDERPEASDAVSVFRNLLHHHVHQSGAGRAATFWSGLGAVRRDALQEIGGFDERLSSMEDIDLGLRLAARGGQIELDPRVQGTHLKRWTLSEMVRVDFAGRGVPWVALLLRNRADARSARRTGGGGPAPEEALNLGWRHRLSAIASLVGAVALARRRPGIALLALTALVGLNRGFYELLGRRLGPGGVAAGVGLHAIHHLTAISAAPAGALLYLRWRTGGTTQRLPRSS